MSVLTRLPNAWVREKAHVARAKPPAVSAVLAIRCQSWPCPRPADSPSCRPSGSSLRCYLLQLACPPSTPASHRPDAHSSGRRLRCPSYSRPAYPHALAGCATAGWRWCAAQGCCAAFAPPMRQLGGNHPGLMHCAPDKSIHPVECGVCVHKNLSFLLIKRSA